MQEDNVCCSSFCHNLITGCWYSLEKESMSVYNGKEWPKGVGKDSSECQNEAQNEGWGMGRGREELVMCLLDRCQIGMIERGARQVRCLRRGRGEWK